jgi:hypothetical protein
MTGRWTSIVLKECTAIIKARIERLAEKARRLASRFEPRKTNVLAKALILCSLAWLLTGCTDTGPIKIGPDGNGAGAGRTRFDPRLKTVTLSNELGFSVETLLDRDRVFEMHFTRPNVCCGMTGARLRIDAVAASVNRDERVQTARIQSKEFDEDA